MVKVRGSARCAGKKREAAMRHRDRCNFAGFGRCAVSNAIYVRRGYANTPVLRELHFGKQVPAI